jgi:UDP-N-acetylglucosamine 4-epimerase
MQDYPKITNQRILVTGGAGFIGSNLVEYFLPGNQVVCLDNLSTGFYRNIEGYIENPNFTFIEGDIRDLEICHKAARGCDYVFQQAALGSVPRSINDPVATNATNIDGFLNMLVAAKEAKVKRFIYAASSSTYGDSAALPKVEHRIGRPLSPYAVTKYVNELYAHVFTQLYGLETIGLRYFNVFGKRQSPNGAYAAVIPLWVKLLLDHERPVINGDGTYSRDFTYVDNVVQANEKAALVPWETVRQRSSLYRDKFNLEKEPDQVFNIAFGGTTTLNELFYALRDNLAKFDGQVLPIMPVYGPNRAGDIPHSHASIEKATAILEYKPEVDTRKGFGLVVDWYYANYGKIIK